MTTLFLDTYAIFGIIKGSYNYKKYLNGYNFITTKFNIMELYYNLLLDGVSKEKAFEYFKRFSEFLVRVDNESLIEALNNRYEQRKKKMSYYDWIGYEIAKKYNVKFLTGDEDFNDMENVEFVKE